MSYRNNRPASRQNEPAAAAPSPQASQSVAPVRTKRPEPSKRSKKPLVIALIILVIVAIAAAAWFFMSRSSVSTVIDSSKFQVVVLKDTTGTPNYFGKLSVINNEYMRLSNVYYLKQKSDSSTSDSQSAAKDASDFELIKLGRGGELHGPEDEMIIPVSQIFYFENLKPTGSVSKAIAEYETKEKQ